MTTYEKYGETLTKLLIRQRELAEQAHDYAQIEQINTKLHYLGKEGYEND